MRERVVAVGGTFDRLHDGHKALLKEAFSMGDAVIVGITSDAFVDREGKARVARYSRRRKQVLAFLESNGLAERARVVMIGDRFGPIMKDPEITGIVVTPETKATALEANRLRAEKGMEPMRVHTIELVLAEDGRPISSTRVRKGELDEHGNLNP